MDTAAFLQTHPVFRLEDAHSALNPAGGRLATRERIKYAVQRGRAKRIARGVYATVPPGIPPSRFQPDPFLVADSVRSDAVFSYHSALSLLGSAHSEWHLCTAVTARRHPPIRLGGTEVRLLPQPAALRRHKATGLGTRAALRLDRELRVTGPERTLLDGFRRPDLVGGVAELVESAAGFAVLELDLLFRLLDAYDEKKLWAAAGWFLESHRASFHVSEDDLARCAARRPKRPQYLVRSERSGVLARRWNLMLPSDMVRGGEPDEPLA